MTSTALTPAAALTGAVLLFMTPLAQAQLQPRPAMQGASGLNSIPPIQPSFPFEYGWGYNPSWYYGIRHPPGYTGYYPGYYSFPGYTSPSQRRDEPGPYRLPAGLLVLPESALPFRRSAAPSVPPPVPRSDTRVSVEVRVPPDAEVWFEQLKTRQTGTVRHFLSPPLARGHVYTYTIRARWLENGRAVDRTQRLQVLPGEPYLLDFTLRTDE